MPPMIKDDAGALTAEEIAEACRDFVARGAMASAALDEQMKRCTCGHIRAQHGPTVDACACRYEGCACSAFAGALFTAEEADHIAGRASGRIK